MTPELAPSLDQGLQVVAALAVVLGLVIALGYLARRGGLRSGRGVLRVEERLTLGRGVQLAVVVAQGRRLLVGVSERQVSLVSDLGEEEEKPGGVESEGSDLPDRPREGVASFAHELTRRLRHGEMSR
ncbi:MAG: flagellar biosynthetic protein FliO [Acidobacteriota bacterium]|nr:flagellar biosynthetic protein FliO [Acidobacteriota bacterium]MDQ7088957.1 flagellar biosynthetic protein FliO [Acidobacteriota bacterium]